MSMNSWVNHGERGLYRFDKTGKLEAIVQRDPETDLWAIKEERQGSLHNCEYVDMDSAARAYEQRYYPRYTWDWVEPNEDASANSASLRFDPETGILVAKIDRYGWGAWELQIYDHFGNARLKALNLKQFDTRHRAQMAPARIAHAVN